jgi:outer membrane protein TolC
MTCAITFSAKKAAQRTGSIGAGVSSAAGQGFGDLFSSDSNNFSVFGLFQWNVLNYARLKNNVRLQDALFQQLLTDYRESELQAEVEVENAIVAGSGVQC